jgi:hypothetical protein
VVTTLDISGNMFVENPRRRIERVSYQLAGWCPFALRAEVAICTSLQAEPRCLLPCVKEPKDFEKADYAVCDAFANAIRLEGACDTGTDLLRVNMFYLHKRTEICSLSVSRFCHVQCTERTALCGTST